MRVTLAADMTEYPLLNAVLFAALGVALFSLAAAILLKLTPLKLWREIAEERNVAAAVFAGSVVIGIALIIAAAMH
jgi:putative membrane protein